MPQFRIIRPIVARRTRSDRISPAPTAFHASVASDLAIDVFQLPANTFATSAASEASREPRPSRGHSLVTWRTQIWQLRNPKITMDLPDPVNAVFQADAFRVRPVEAPRKSGGLPLFKPSLKIQRDDPHNQNSAVTVAPVSTVLHVRAALKVCLNRAISSKAGPSVVMPALQRTAPGYWQPIAGGRPASQ